MISENEAIELLHKYKVPVNIINHCKAVAKTAMKIVEENQIKDVDVQKLKLACLLHDLGRVKTLKEHNIIESEDNRHETHSVEILKKEGLPEIAEIISKHGFMLANYKLEELTIEEKLLIVSDVITKEDQRVSLQERAECLLLKFEKAKDYGEIEQFKKAMPLYEAIAKELGVE